MHTTWAWSNPIQATYTAHNGGLVILKQLTLHIMVVLLFFIGYKQVLSSSNDLELSIVSVIRIIVEFVSLYFKDHIALLLYFRYHPSFTRSSVIF